MRISLGAGKAQLQQGVHVPLRPVPPSQGQAAGNLFHPRGVGVSPVILHFQKPGVGPVPVVFPLLLLVHQIAVPVGVEVQQHPAGAQYPPPFPVGLHRVLQVPGEVAGHDHVEAAIGEGQGLGVHLTEVDPLRQGSCVVPGFREHLFGEVHRRHPIAPRRQDHGVETRPGAHVQHPRFLRAPLGEAGGEIVRPDALPAALQVLFDHVGVGRGPLVPIGHDLLFQLVHAVFFLCFNIGLIYCKHPVMLPASPPGG